MIVTVAGLAGGRDVDPRMFADLTAKTVLAIGDSDDGFAVQFATNLSAAETAAVRRRCTTCCAVTETATAELEAHALIKVPTPLQNTTAIQALVRLMLHRHDGTV